MKRSQATKSDDQHKHEWAHDSVPAVRELLDHIAKELAAEYVRLLKEETKTETRDVKRGRKK